jgi:predicted HAD superfamily hydrolase
MMNNCKKKEDLLSREAKIISFDVFDTAITRITAEPKGIFFKLQKMLLASRLDMPTELLNCFVQERIDAERSARQKKTREEISLSDIYREIGRRYHLSSELVESLMNMEIDTELECVRAIPSNSRLIHELRKEGNKIIFLSDMYLPESAIQRLLKKVGIFDERDEIYVSCEYGLTKSTGNLFLHVLDKENCDPNQLIHVGDNCKSDYLMAKKVGKMAAYHFNDSHLNRFEKILREPAGARELDLSWQLIAGASRVARLQSSEEADVHRRALHEVGANIAGPILWGFVSWVLERASLQKIRRLYFIARDGQILYEIAARLCAATNNDIELRYLYGSRQAWHLSAVSVFTDRELHWITLKDPYLSLRLVASRLSLEPKTLTGHLREAGFPEVYLDQDLLESQIKELKKVFLTSAELQSFIFAESERQRQDVISYLRQEGLLDQSSYAIVDSGWNGRLQNSLISILHMAGREDDIFGFYFGLLSAIDPPGSKEAYFFSPSAPYAHKKLGSSVLHLLELMMSADHGITVTYQRDSNGQWKPVLKDTPHDLMGNLGLGALREGILCFVQHLDLSSIRLDHNLLREKIMQILKEFYLSPSREAAIALGRVPFSTDQTETNFLPFAPALSLKSACRFFLTVSGRERLALTFWIHGSRVQSSMITNIFLSIMSLVLRFINNTREFFLVSRNQISGGSQ